MPQSLTVGSPRFRDGRLQQLLAESGAEAAWATAVAEDARAAPGIVDGEFAVGLHMPSGNSFLSVDRFGTRSLCFRAVGKGVQFAERADSLARQDVELDPQAIFDYLYFHAIPSPRTIFKGVSRLPPAHCAWSEHAKFVTAPYWVPEFTPRRESNFGALRSEFLQLLRDAVERQLDGSKPACFLSGGTDSSTVAGMIGRVGGTPAATYSIGFEAEGYDEMHYARLAARHFGTQHHEYYVTPDDLVQSIPTVAAHYDQPFGNSSALPAYYCARMAREDGVSRILAGDGGDELFGGNSRYAKQRIFDGYRHLPAGLRRAIVEPALERSPLGRLPLLRKGRSYVEQAKVPMPDRLQFYNLLLRLGPESVLMSGLLAQVDQAAPLHQQREVWAAAKADHDLNRTLAFDWRYTLAESDLPKVRLTCQLAGLQVGFPMLDSALVDFSLSLPVEYKLRGLKLRWFFKEALRGFLPVEIITKKKQGFGLPFGPWLMRHRGLRRLADDALGSLGTRGIVRSDFIRNLLQSQLPSHPGYFGEMVWILMMLEFWLQAHAPDYRLDK